jgi:hypothetical protein
MIRLSAFFWLAVAAALTSCAAPAAIATPAVASPDRIAIDAVTALALAELAYNSGEATATAAVQSGRLSAAQDAAIGDAVHRARTWRDQARALVAAGGDASAALTALAAALGDIRALGGAAAAGAGA